MKFVEREFVPLILGGDINTYSVSRAFYEEYGIRSYVRGKFETGPSYRSRLVDYKAIPDIDRDETFLKVVKEFAGERKDKKIILMGCGDNYIAMISRNKKNLPENVIAPYIDFDFMNSIQQKETFYQLCDKYGVDYPGTFVYKKEMGTDFTIDFPFPVVLKPSDSISYWDYPFPGQSKVYIIQSREELDRTLKDIYDAGYQDDMIIQDMIPGNDEYMRVLTSYSDRNGKVKMMCLGHVLLEEHTPHGMGNHAVIITEPDLGKLSGVKDLLEEIGYVGFSNFDIKYDRRDGKYKFFELNTRQGRSNYYVTNSGLNVAKYIVEDYVYGNELEFEAPDREYLWMVVPKKVAFKYVKDEETKKLMKQLIADGRYVNPVFKEGDMGFNRTLRMLKTHFGHFSKFKKYYHVD